MKAIANEINSSILIKKLIHFSHFSILVSMKLQKNLILLSTVSLTYCPFLPLSNVPLLAIVPPYAHCKYGKRIQQSPIHSGIVIFSVPLVVLHISRLTSFLSYQSGVHTHLDVQSLYVN